MTMTAAEMRQSVEVVGAVRDAVGPDVDLLIELHGRLNPTTAIQLANELAPFKPMFFEEPIPPENLDAMAYVRSRSPIPLATGERIFTKFGWRDALAKKVADIIQPDLVKCGGILEMKKIAAMAEAEYIMLAPHNPLGPIGSAATLHLSACTPNFQIQEMVRESGGQWRPVAGRPDRGRVGQPAGERSRWSCRPARGSELSWTRRWRRRIPTSANRFAQNFGAASSSCIPAESVSTRCLYRRRKHGQPAAR